MSEGAVWWRPYRSVDGIDVFAVDLSPSATRKERAFSLLSQPELRRYRQFRVEDARDRFLLARGALRLLLGKRLNRVPAAIDFATQAYGKPYAIVDGVLAPVAFNISHSGDAALIALTGSRSIGIDLEQRRPHVDFDSVAAGVFGAGERALLAGLSGRDKLDLFYRLWTCKEALMKAKGTGFSYDPANFEAPDAILAGAKSARFGFPDEKSQHWLLRDLGSDTYAATLAYRR